jgi:hypothetical protein
MDTLLFPLAQTPTTGPATSQLAGVPGTLIFWVGVAFAAFFALVFTAKVFLPPRNSVVEQQNLRLLGAIFGGAASGFITGGSMVSANVGNPGLQIAAFGSAGFGISILIWITWKIFPPTPTPLKDGVQLFIPQGLTFQRAISVLAEMKQAVAIFEGFTEAELAAPLEEQQLETEPSKGVSAMNAMMLLMRNVTVQRNMVRPYTVTRESGSYVIKVN